eukprot:GHRR01021008.1.p1 GENE.GHRR01021008.1~~GHRR01021008.1.p1  ORF type:complete len:253 (+),score=41.99 GHRR01021008.1:220-978(+)
MLGQDAATGRMQCLTTHQQELLTASKHTRCAACRPVIGRLKAPRAAEAGVSAVDDITAPAKPTGPFAVVGVAKGQQQPAITPLGPAGATLEVSPAAEKELLATNGFRSTRRTKLVCTIGPASCSYEVLSKLAENGMNVARLNMTHGNHAWHEQVVERIRRLNKEKGYCIAIMVDTEGSEIHTGELAETIKIEVGSQVVFTIRSPAPPEMSGLPVVGVNYDSLVEDVEVCRKRLCLGASNLFSYNSPAGMCTW